MEGESCVTRSIIDELHSSDLQRDQRKVKLDLLEVSLEIFPWDIQGDQIEGETGVSRNIIDELLSQDIEGDQM